MTSSSVVLGEGVRLGTEALEAKTPLLLNSALLEFPQIFPGTERRNAREPESSSGFWGVFLYLLDSF